MKSQNCFIQFDGIQTDQTYKNLEHVFDVVKWEYHAHRPSPSYYGTYRPTDMYVEHKNIQVEIKTPNTAIFDSMFSTKIFDKVIITRFYQEEPFLTVLLKQVVLDRLKMIEEEDNQEMFPKTILFLGYEFIQVQSFMNPYGETPLGNDLASCKLDRGYQTQSNSIYVPPPTPPEPTPQEIIMPPLPSKKALSDSEDKQEALSKLEEDTSKDSLGALPTKNESEEREEKHKKHTYPTDGEITSPYLKTRIHPVTGKNQPHPALDFNTKSRKYGEPVRATESGVIVEIRTGQKKGDDKINSITMQYNCGKRGGYYGHVTACTKENDQVSQGDTIGYIDDSGFTTGPHVHYQGYKTDISPWKIIDPTNWFE